MKEHFNNYFNIAFTVSLLSILTSCKRDYVCSCTNYELTTGQSTEISRDVFRDTKSKAKKKCEDKWCGAECGCSLK